MIDHKGVENGVRERYGVKGEGERSQRETEGKKESEKRMRKCVKEREGKREYRTQFGSGDVKSVCLYIIEREKKVCVCL